MELSLDVKKTIQDCVLCWLATATPEGEPNVSPKEVFTYVDNRLVIANIASPNSVKNILVNSSVCVSMIDILVQKGYQLKGTAEIVKEGENKFDSFYAVLNPMTGGRFPFDEIISVDIHSVKKIVAPSYLRYPETRESDQVEGARKRYTLNA